MNRVRAGKAIDLGKQPSRSDGLPARARGAALGLLAAVVALFCMLPLSAAAAASPSPWWKLNTSLQPAHIGPDGETTLVLLASNVGDAPTVGPVTITATMPPGATVVEEEVEGVMTPAVSFFAFPVGAGGVDLGTAGEGRFLELCHLADDRVICSTEPGNPEVEGEFGSPLSPYETLELRAKIKDTSSSEDSATVEVSGGSAAPASAFQELPHSASPVAFGAERLSVLPEEEGGQVDTRAGSHPFQLTTVFDLKQNEDPLSPPALARNLHFKLPAGQVANLKAVPTCSAEDFTAVVPVANGGAVNRCPASSAIGVATITFDEPNNFNLRSFSVPLFDLEPASGEPARFGFVFAGSPVILDTAVRSGPGDDYGVTVSSSNITQIANLLSSTVTFWGAPADPRHHSSRGWDCLMNGYWAAQAGLPCPPSSEQAASAFLTLPTNCEDPFATTVEGTSWPNEQFPQGATLQPLTYSLSDEAGNPLSLSACNQVPFSPEIAAEPTSNAASSPTGLSFDIDVDDEGLTNPEGIAQSQIKRAVVTLPRGFTANPSVAEGLKACSEEQYESESLQTEAGAGCPSESKVGDVEVVSPLVEGKLTGSLYVAQQGLNPNHNLLTLYLLAKNRALGIIVKQTLKVTPDERTGQLTTEVDNIPQLPFSHFHLGFRTGQRAPLITPPACGTYTVNADLYPWANPSTPVQRESSFQITQGPEGQPCPSGGVPPFHPSLLAGSENPTAAAFSPFYTDIQRRDSEQEITHFSIKLPPGEIGILAGIPECTDAQIAVAEAREREGGGGEEEAAPSCPAASQIGRSNVGSGVGNVLAYAPGKIYLAGPYHGAPLSLVSITAAKVGPFDLGTVVVRFALRIDPETAEVFVDSQGSDPIPHIVDGIPIHLRDIRAYVDRPDFTLNGTSCNKTSTASTVLGSGLDFVSAADDVPVTVSSPFQLSDCAALPFHPKLKLSLKGAMKRTGAPAFRAELTARPGEANIGRSVVTLPSSEFLFNAHIQDACGIGTFRKTGSCPEGSTYGRARAFTPVFDEPLEGPVYLMSGLGHKLPDLYAVLKNSQVEIHLDGIVSSLQRKRNGEAISLIRNTFATVPDAPVSKFVLEMAGGKKGLLQNSTNLCEGTNRAISEFTAHSGKVYDTKPVVVAKNCRGKNGDRAKKPRRGRG